MIKQKATNIPLWAWHVIALIPVLIAVPNGTFMKLISEEMDPAWINVARFALIVVILMPFLIHARKAITKKNLQYAVLQGVAYSVSVACYVFAISLSQASYVSVINLGIPIMLMIYSVYLTRERVTRNAMVGISIAALGAFVIVGFPLLMGQGFTSDFNPLATILSLIGISAYPLSVIFSRKANDNGLPITAAFGISAIVVFCVSLVIALIVSGSFPAQELFGNPHVMLMIAYTAIGISLLARMITVLSYKHLGSAVTGGLYYIEGFASILLPILVLGERMTSEMLFGGILILLGVLVAETHHHASVHKDHHQAGHRHV